ncbi:MAG TPA: hypothetical protein PKD13_13870, partial [Mariniflexile sp.]|nr:hypothetical protein [Mariniflexile sp.]
MEKFKTHWDIQHNWQLIFPFFGVVVLLYSSFKLAFLLLKDQPTLFVVLLTFLFFTILLKFVLFLFKRLENKWKLTYKWEMIRVFLVFAITGTA